MADHSLGWADDGARVGLMGYGDPTMTFDANRSVDAKRLDQMEGQRPVYMCDASIWASPAASDENRFVTIAKLREKLAPRFQWDWGFGTWACEDIVYGTRGGVEPGPQEIGSCVGTSHAELLAARIATEILLGQGEEPLGQGAAVVPYEPYSYGIGRCNRDGELGGPRIIGDGSYCSWQIEATMLHGILPSDRPGLPQPPPDATASVQRQWGDNSGDVLNRWKPQALPYTLSSTLRVRSAADLKGLIIGNLIPAQICSGWGFAYSHTVDGLAVYAPRGSWPHSMQLIGWFGYRGQEYVVVRNQWGRDAHRDPGLGIPLGCFVVEADIMDDWITDAECLAIAEVAGRPSPEGFPH